MQSTDKTESVVGHILVADDDLIVRMVVKKMLEQAGHGVELVADGHEVLAALESGDYDLILMDCLMPVMDGFETTRVIRSAGPGRINPAIPVIAMTGLTEEADYQQCRDAGMDKIINKPIDSDSLLAAIQLCLGKPENTGPAPQQEETGPQQFWEGDFLDSVIDEFLAEVPQVTRDLQQAVGQGDTDKLRNISHRFRGATDILNASTLSARSRALEQSAKEGNLQLASTHALELIEELQRLTSLLAE